MQSPLLISGDFASILRLLCWVMFVIQQIYSVVRESSWGTVEEFLRLHAKLLNPFCFKIIFSIWHQCFVYIFGIFFLFIFLTKRACVKGFSNLIWWCFSPLKSCWWFYSYHHSTVWQSHFRGGNRQQEETKWLWMKTILPSYKSCMPFINSFKKSLKK